MKATRRLMALSLGLGLILAIMLLVAISQVAASAFAVPSLAPIELVRPNPARLAASALSAVQDSQVSGLHCSDPHAHDATSYILPTHMSLTVQQVAHNVLHALRITIDAANITFPPTVDSLLSPSGWTVTGEAGSNYFGKAVAAAGDVNDDGYTDVVVGAEGYNSSQGRVYVYTGSAEGLSATPAFTATGETALDSFGRSVGTAGDVNGDGYADVVVGAYGHNIYQGQVYGYTGGVGGLSATPAFTATGETINDAFGYAAGTAGDVNGDGYADVVVGAWGFNPGGASDTGRAYVYTGGAGGLSTTPAFTATGEAADNRFGYAVGTTGDVNGDGYSDVIVGAYGHDPGGAANTGRAYVYTGGAGGLSATPAFTVTGETADDRLGLAVATAGDVNGDGYADVIVGVPGYNPGGAVNTGRIYVYTGGAGGLSATPAFTATGEADRNHFGWAAGTAGDVNGDGYADVIVGAWGYDPGGASWTGRAYVYIGGAGGLSATSAWTATGEAADNYFGGAVGTAGDMNGDGYADVIVGAYGYLPGGASLTGRVYVYTGGAGGLSATPAFTATGEAAGDRFGWAVGTAGDVNGDGYADIVVGADGYDAYRGRVFVYSGGAGGLSSTPTFSATGEAADNAFGYAVGTAGDVNGDGYADVVVGAYGYDPGSGPNIGRVYVYTGGAAGLLPTPTFSATGEAADNHFGSAVGTVGDVNGDGYADVGVGGWGYNPGSAFNTGRAYGYAGGAVGLFSSPIFTTTGEAGGSSFGYTVGTAGDVNGDGYADVAIGAYSYDPGGASNSGRAYVFQGNGVGGRVVLARQSRSDGSGLPVQPWGLSHNANGFQVHMRAADPVGRGRVKLQVQTCLPGKAFGDAACYSHVSADWTDVTTSTAGVSLTETITSLNADTLYRWRARAVYDSPFGVHGPWRRFLGQALEADARTSIHGLYLPLVLRNN